jgi:LysM domain
LGPLSGHLIASGSVHGRLRFHPDCPRCKDRLAGNLRDDQLMPRRTTAAVAAGVMALSSATPATAVPPEPDQEQEGVAAPPAVGGEPIYDPGFDPGGEDTVLEVEVGPVAAPDAGGESDTGDGPPVEAEPTDDPEARLVLPDEPEPAPVLPPVQTPVQPDARVPAPTPPPSPQQVAPAPPPAPEVGRIDEGADTPRHAYWRISPPRKEPAPVDERKAASAGAIVAAQQTEAPAALPVAEPDPQPAAAALPPPAPIEGDRYRVRPGDSLWSIAKRLLGPDASNGRIAQEVNRLWQVNAGRIATGDPSLIHPGIELRLR